MNNTHRRRVGAKVTLALLSVIILLILLSTTVSSQMLGDVNFDGVVDIRDVVLVQRHILGYQPPLTAAQLATADVNGDGVVNVVDANLMMQYIQGYINSFPNYNLHDTVLISPVEGASIEGSMVSFQWGAVTGATRYQLEITRVSDGSIFRTVDLGNGTFTTQYGFVDDGAQYKWRVRAGNSYHWGYWSGYRYLTNGSAFQAPTLGSPADNASLESSSVSFQWSAVTGVTRYQLEVIRVNDGFIFKNVELGNVVSNTQTGFPSDGTQYRWRVRAGNATSWGSWSHYRHFTSGVLLPAPTLTAPAHNSNITGSAVIFNWNLVPGASKYQLEVYRGHEYLPFKEITLGNFTSTELFGFLGDGEQYKWRVRAGNNTGWGAWSTFHIFDSGSLPSVPTLSSPAADSNVPGKQISFQWNAVSGATMYELEIYNENDGSFFSKALVTDSTSSLQKGFPDDHTRFKWRVKAGGYEGWGPWSDYRYFTNGILPSGPILTKPDANENLYGNRITFEWDPVPGADRYELLIEYDMAGGGEFRRIPVGFAFASRQSDFPNDGSRFRWSVRAGNANGWGDFSQFRTFTNGSPYGYPNLQTPAAHSTQGGTSINFSWDPVSGATRYNLEVVDVRTGVTKTSDTLTTVSSNQLGFPNDGSEYKWRLRAGDSNRWGAWSAYRYFVNETVNVGAPAAPSLLSPAVNASAASESIEFGWTAVAATPVVTKYKLQVVKVEGGQFVKDMEITMIDFNNPATTQGGFPNDGTAYMWRVKAFNLSGWGSWSFYRNFTNGGPWWVFSF